jgi:hypothetical protein
MVVSARANLPTKSRRGLQAANLALVTGRGMKPLFNALETGGQTGRFLILICYNSFGSNFFVFSEKRELPVCAHLCLCVDELAAFQLGQGFEGFAGFFLGEAQVIEVLQI